MADLKKRRHAREWAVKLLCQLDMNPETGLEEALAAFWRQLSACRRDELADAETDDTAADADAPPPRLGEPGSRIAVRSRTREVQVAG